MRIGRFRLAMIVLIFPAPSVFAAVITIGASKDTTLYQDALGGLGGGKGSSFFLGRLGSLGDGALRRATIAFDLSAIPVGAVVSSAALTLTEQKGNGGPQPVDLHRLTTNWGEGASTGGPQGSLAVAGDATWTFNFFNTSSWTNAGGDFDPAVSATQMVDFSGAVTWGSTPGMVADVQGWLNDPGANFGWVLIGNESILQTAKEFASRESFSGQPALAVTYSVPEPANMALLGATVGMLLARRRRGGSVQVLRTPGQG